MNSRENKTIIKLDNFLNNDLDEFKNDIHVLMKEYKRKSKRLETIIKQSDAQQKELLNLNEELDEYKNHLEKKVEEEIEKRKQQDKILLHQSKLAAMGEMIDAVAHQWKQPLNNIYFNAGLIEYDFDANLIDKEYITNYANNISRQIDHMTNTLNEFRTFFKPDKEVIELNILKVIENTLVLIQDEFKKDHVQIEINQYEEMYLSTIENEFQHMILNLLNNSKDAFIENKLDDRKININIYKDRLEVIDNAGGIPEEIIANIFNVNFTTKKKGSGAGLYMSKLIADKYNCNLFAKNKDNGVIFIFKI